MNRRYLVLYAFLLLISCSDSKYEISNSTYKVLREPVTQVFDKPIQLLDLKSVILDKSRYDEIVHVPDYFSGLSPKYPMAETFSRSKIKFPSLKCSGGLILSCENLLILKDSVVIELNSKELVDRYFLPIENRSEAISYLSLLTDSYPLYNFSFLNRRFEFSKKILHKTYVDSLSNKYIVHLFKYKVFGCSHPYFGNTYEVDKNGVYKLLNQEEIFINPKERGHCVD